MDKLFDIFALFRKGTEVANKEAWKDGGNAATLLVPVFVLLAKIAGDFGYSVQLSTEDAAAIAAGIVAVVQFVVHNITSKHAGILPAKPADSTSDSVSAGGVSSKEDASVQDKPKSGDIDPTNYIG